MYAYAYVYIYIYICKCVYMYICRCVGVCMCVYIYMLRYACAYIYIYMRKVYVYICVNIYMRVYAYIYACIYMGGYLCVCMWTHVNMCEGPYHPPRFGRRGCCFYQSDNTESDWYKASPYGLVQAWLISNFPIALTGDIIFLYQSLLLLCTLHKWYSHAPQPCAPTVDH